MKKINHIFKFLCIGSFGFCVDAGSLILLKKIIGLIAATLIAYFIAATATWFAHRTWTYRHISTQKIMHQWLSYLSANSAGACLNRSCVFLLYLMPFFRHNPVIALAIGSLVGLFVNFHITHIIFTKAFKRKTL